MGEPTLAGDNVWQALVPASSANLGPGFDSFAIALPLLAEFDLRPARTWSVSVDGEGNSHENGN